MNIRELCMDEVTDDQVFDKYGDLPNRMQEAFIQYLRNGDTQENNLGIARIIRAAFERAVDEEVEMRDIEYHEDKEF